MTTEDNALTFKILSLGESGVGKTCFILRYIDGKFDSTHLSTIGVDFKPKTITYKSKTIKLKIWDTAGQERYRNLTQQYYKNADGILLMFDISNHESFNTINYWMEQIKLFAHLESTPIILIGTKSDLAERKVSLEEAEQAAKKLTLKYFESSAKINIGINEVFDHLCEKIFEMKSSFIYDFNENKKTILINLKKEKQQQKELEERNNRCCHN